MLIRIDLIFSYWLFAWYLAYMAKITPYNPKIALILATIENTVMLIGFIVYGTNPMYIAQFLLINTLIKVIPLYTIYKTKSTITDVYALLIYFALYVVWVHINGATIYSYLRKTYLSILRGKNETPAMWVMSKILEKVE